MLLIVDNRDSFVFNLDQAFRALGAATRVVRADRLEPDAALRTDPQAVVLSPGPGRPEDMGALLPFVHRLPPEIPVLGVCLGHQALAVADGASLVETPRVVHGRTSPVDHDGRGLFAGLPSPLELARYHSLAVDPRTLPRCWRPAAWTGTGRGRILMAMEHTERPWFGWQFHPESFLSPAGPRLLARFLAATGSEAAA